MNKQQPLLSIITVCRNSESTIRRTIESVIAQDFHNMEYIVLDGNSTDNTPKIIENYLDFITYYQSKPDDGMYHALNQGIEISKGSFIGILNADDYYSSNESLKTVAKFLKPEVDMFWADVNFISLANSKLVRKYKSFNNYPFLFKFGLMPAHPSIFINQKLFHKHGNYNTEYKIASDFDLILRFISKTKNNIYHPFTLINMSIGGISNKGYESKKTIQQEITRSLNHNRIRTNILLLNMRYLIRLVEIIRAYYWRLFKISN